MKPIRVSYLAGLVCVLGSITTGANASVDPVVHQKCLSAGDYKGCIDANSSVNITSSRVNGSFPFSSTPEVEVYLLGEATRFLGNAKKTGFICDKDGFHPVVSSCYIAGKLIDKFGDLAPTGWLNPEENASARSTLFYLFPVPEMAFAQEGGKRTYYLIFKELRKSRRDSIPGTSAYVVPGSKSKTRCTSRNNTKIRQQGSALSTSQSYYDSRLDSSSSFGETSGFNFDINSNGTLNCNTEDDVPVVVPGDAAIPASVNWWHENLLVNCTDMTYTSKSRMSYGDAPRPLITNSSSGKIINGTYGWHLVGTCEMFEEKGISYPMSIIDPETGNSRDDYEFVEVIKRTNKKFGFAN